MISGVEKDNGMKTDVITNSKVSTIKKTKINSQLWNFIPKILDI